MLFAMAAMDNAGTRAEGTMPPRVNGLESFLRRRVFFRPPGIS
jgi:hypothetical protein